MYIDIKIYQEYLKPKGYIKPKGKEKMYIYLKIRTRGIKAKPRNTNKTSNRTSRKLWGKIKVFKRFGFIHSKQREIVELENINKKRKSLN